MILDYIKRTLFNYITQAIMLLSIAAISTVSILTYSSNRTAFNVASDLDSNNLFINFLSYSGDILIQLFGASSFILPICFLSWAIITYKNEKVFLLPLKFIIMLLAMMLISVPLSKIKSSTLPATWGGASGLLLSKSLKNFGLYLDLICVILGAILFISCLGINWSSLLSKSYSIPNNLNTSKVTFKATPRITLRVEEKKAKNDEINSPASNQKTYEQLTIPKFNSKTQLTLPPVDLLHDKKTQSIQSETNSELRRNAESLLGVLNDFGVKGQIIDVSKGPVVTLYEFEPAAGTKSSRVIGLADDVARSLSAISTRIAVIPGRNVLGIELPNKQRSFFCLKELVQTEEYNNPDIILPLIFGRDLSGKPYIADLAKMPHLLVAGTTGSGKSVAINTMIMSLLYRYTPEDCRLIMIDPKMLELSAYDGIPHLLTPVVTEPSKAIVALKWAVKEMENRYRLMSNVGVRNIANYNLKISESIAEGKILERTVQVGFDHETGKPVYQSVPLNMEKLPFIVVIVDEMADLMLVAGKDIESSIQRLAQMARAAGIHIIMATQRPSVDVITGVIKANFPSRISFKVTSKIDSRTILGEQGAEQLLGMGDMLYMGNGSKITRVHGPFVDDKEVEKVTSYLKSTGTPDYIYSVTEAQGDDKTSEDDFGEEGNADDIYKKALQIIKLERKVSISYIQRCLRIGYNRAADIVDRMEKEGVVSPPNHTGKREILLPED